MAAAETATVAEGSWPAKHYWNAEKGLWSWLTTVDHKRIGIMYMVLTLSAFFLGGMAALVVRLELFAPGQQFLTEKLYNQMFTLHGAVMVFLFIIPSIPGVLGNFFLPMQLGAIDVAFPKLNLLSLYVYVAGACIALSSIVFGAIDTGWTFYTPYSVTTDTSVVMMTLAAFVLGFSSILTGLNFVVTVHKMRAPGLTWFRMPLFVWATYATALIQILATPVLAITLLLLMMERLLGIGIFDPAMGGDPVLFQHFFWFYSHPAVYIMILPAMGIVSEIIATFSRRPIFGYRFVAFSSVAIAVIGFLVWGHHMFVSGQSEFATMAFSFLTFFVSIPSAIKVLNWTATLYKGSNSLESPMLYAIAFIIQFTIGGLTGIPLGALSTDIHLTDTYYVIAHFHYVAMGGTVVAFIGGLHYWWPKITGRMYSETLGKLGALLIFLGFNLTFFIQFVLGSLGMPRRYANYLPEFETMHKISTVGTWVLLSGFLVVAWCFLSSLKNGKIAGPNPWGGSTLEWRSPSPPPTTNFLEAPKVSTGPYHWPEELPAPKRRAA